MERRKKEERRVNGFFTAEWKLLMCGGMDGMHVNQMDWNGTCLLTRLFSGALNSKFGRSMWRRRERKKHLKGKGSENVKKQFISCTDIFNVFYLV